ncbi:DUF1697 domain-containing protein [Streptomyces tremellae]|uniref:DUF1697 domain-containing protein n=1 Tax=Streptomyces tremellae TaxID=1124239 RepID=A0ABP7F6P6_9ACTN
MTTSYAVLLRGIDVSGSTQVPMAGLRETLGGLGLEAVRTRLRSGNAVFRTPGDDRPADDALRARIEAALRERFGSGTGCVVRDAAYLEAVVAGCPFDAHALKGRQLHVTYFSAPVDPARLADLDPGAYLPEEFRLGDRALYLLAPDGVGRSKLAAALGRPARYPGVVATSRNWNTAVRLMELTRG